MDGAPIELDTALDVCEHKHRRIVLATLGDQQQPVPITDLTNVITTCHWQRQASSNTMREVGLHGTGDIGPSGNG